MTTTFKHIAYFNDAEDIFDLSHMTDQEILDYYLDGCGVISTPSDTKVSGSERKKLNKLPMLIGRNGKRYIITKDFDGPLDDDYDTNNPDCDDFVDIYLVENK